MSLTSHQHFLQGFLNLDFTQAWVTLIDGKGKKGKFHMHGLFSIKLTPILIMCAM